MKRESERPSKHLRAAAWRHVPGLVLLLLAPLVPAQDEVQWTHPELQWHTIETEHFLVHFHEGAEQTGKLTAKIAEDIYTPLTSLYGYEPDGKIHFVIKDYDDYSNGGAYYLDNKVEIWASALDFELRGTHNWLRNVITHEFAHMISLGAARKMTRRIPAFYVQWFDYEKEKRPDVLYGYPDRIVSYAVPMTTVAPWFAEGVAQYQLPGLDYDLWDSHRDMVLRTAVVEDRLLGYSEMNVFGKNSIGSERVYNQGFALVSYIAARHGVSSLQEIARNMRSALRFSFDSAVAKATGKSGSELYREWKQHLETSYAERLGTIQAHRVEGTLVQTEGSGNFQPRWSPDGKTLAFLTNAGADYLGMTALVVRDQATGRLKTLKAGVHGAFSWSPDGTALVYGRKSEKNPHHSEVFDLYLYELGSGKERRLTHAARAHSPSWSLQGDLIACVINRDGTQNLALFDLGRRQLRQLTDYRHQEQVYAPQWSPDGRSILFSFSQSRGRELYLYDMAAATVAPVEALAQTVSQGRQSDCRDAVFSPDGRRIIFSWDLTGIFNIYALELESGDTMPLTNVVGGAFMPAMSPTGELAYSTFVAEGYKIAHLQLPVPLSPEWTVYPPAAESRQMLAALDGNGAQFDVSGIKHSVYDDRQVPDYEIKPYGGHYTSIAVLPRLTFDYGTTKIGSYFYSSDMLDKYSFVGGVSVNRDKDLDLFLLFDYRKFGPTLFLEAFNQVRHASDQDEELGDLRFRYNLSEVDLGVRVAQSRQHQSSVRLIYSRYHANIGFQERGIKQNFGYTYYQGRVISLRHQYRQEARAVDGEINPRSGREVKLQYDVEFNNFIHSDPDKAFTLTDYGTFVPNYEPHNAHRAQAQWTEHVGLPGRTGLTLLGRAGMLTREVDSFFYFFAGGMDGVRGYPYYSMEGRYLLHGRATCRIPLFRHMDFPFLHLYFDKLSVAAAYDYGGAFVKTRGFSAKLHDSITLQMRAELFSFYGFPTRLSFNAAYGFDQFKNRGFTYGKEWRYYLTVAFDFWDD